MPDLNIGLKQARRLTELPLGKRLEFVADGFPIILKSATSLLAAAKKLEEHQREKDILQGFAEEEAAKGLILLDVVRCPPKLIPQKLTALIRMFYDHLSRLIYAKACFMRPMHTTQLQDYVDHYRKTHYLEGEYGEYILPNMELFTRESKLYADIASYEDKALFWNEPHGHDESLTPFEFDPPALRVLQALSAVGALTANGLRIVADVWGQIEFAGKIGPQESDECIQTMMERLIEKNLPLERATSDDVGVLYQMWQFPMYNIDFRRIEVTLEELNAERDAQLPY